MVNAVLQHFLERIKGYYGPYNATMREDVERWAAKLTAEELRGIYKITTETYSSQYGRPPDISVFKKALHEYREATSMTVEDVLALPDPDYEARKRELTEEDREMGAAFISKLVEGMGAGQHPVRIYEEWAYENPVWVEEKLGPIQDVVRRVYEEYEEKGGDPNYTRPQWEEDQGRDSEGFGGGRDDLLREDLGPDPEGDPERG